MTRLDRVCNLLNSHEEFESRQEKQETTEDNTKRIKNWTTIYRRNWDIYAEHELGIKLKWFQLVVIYLIGISDTFFLFCSRGLSKTFMTALICVIQAMLYPNSEIVITATTIKTAKKFVEKKIEGELCNAKFSKKLTYLKDIGAIKFKYDQEEIKVSFTFNNSWIIVLPEVASSVGERITTLVCEEARLSKLSLIDRVFAPMKRIRRTGYINNPEYEGDPLLMEKAKTIYLTSVSFKHEPIWGRWVKVVEDTFNGVNEIEGVSNVYVGDVYTALTHNFITIAEYLGAKRSSSETEFNMEYLNESPSEGDGSFYNYKMFKENSILPKPFIPPTYDEWLYKYQRGTLPYFRDKMPEEVRCIYVDFAFNDSVKAENDLTVIGCMSGYPDENHEKMLRNIEYMESFSGGDKYGSLLRIRELFLFYGADYLIVDTRNGGSDRLQDLTIPYENTELGITMRGFGFSYEEDITNHYYSKDKLEKMRERVVDKDPMNVAIPVMGDKVRNDSFHRQMRDALLGEKIRLIKDSTIAKRELEEEDIELSLTNEEEKRHIYPHIQVDCMVREAIKLENKLIDGGYTKLSTVGSETKDKIVATEYANYLFYLLEMKMEKSKQKSTTDFSSYQLLF